MSDFLNCSDLTIIHNQYESFEKRLIFIGGSPRSGTTLVQNILDSHPDIYGGAEFLHIPEIIKLRGALQRSVSRGYISLYCNSEEVDIKIKSLLFELLLPLADKNNCFFLSEKTPENIFVFAELMQLLPSAYFIHVIRDPRAIVSSMLQVGKRAVDKDLKPPSFTKDIFSSIKYLKRCVEAGANITSACPEKILTVKYEDLVRGPEDETRRICNFLGLNWKMEMVSPGNKRHPGEQAITVKSDELWYDKSSYYKNPDPSIINKWLKKLTLSQKAKVFLAFKDNKFLKENGYDLYSGNFSEGEKMLWNCNLFFLNCCRKLLSFVYKLPNLPGKARICRVLINQVGNAK